MIRAAAKANQTLDIEKFEKDMFLLKFLLLFFELLFTINYLTLFFNLYLFNPIHFQEFPTECLHLSYCLNYLIHYCQNFYFSF